MDFSDNPSGTLQSEIESSIPINVLSKYILLSIILETSDVNPHQLDADPDPWSTKPLMRMRIRIRSENRKIPKIDFKKNPMNIKILQ